MTSATQTVRDLSSLVRLSHTIFGLPFALAAAALGHRFATSQGDEGLSIPRVLLILLAFTAARTAAMAFNRIADRDIDASNPRTQQREIPRGAVSVLAAKLLTAASLAVFVGAAFALGPLPGKLSFPCVLVILGYSLVKRWSWAAHLVLGLALALAPGGAFVAVTGSFEGLAVPVLLMGAVATWVAGFDILYSLQDRTFDADAGLHSIPVTFGERGALWISGILHALTLAALVALHMEAALHLPHMIGVGLVGAILVYEHSIVRPGDLSRIDKAFFDLNGYISLAYLACVLLDLWLFA